MSGVLKVIVALCMFYLTVTGGEMVTSWEEGISAVKGLDATWIYDTTRLLYDAYCSYHLQSNVRDI